MDEKGTMTATFEPTLDVYKLLEGKPTEYVVVNPVTVEARFKDGDVMRYPQEIRERVTRCRDCVHYWEEDPWGNRDACSQGVVRTPHPRLVRPDGFCAWAQPREED